MLWWRCKTETFDTCWIRTRPITPDQSRGTALLAPNPTNIKHMQTSQRICSMRSGTAVWIGFAVSRLLLQVATCSPIPQQALSVRAPPLDDPESEFKSESSRSSLTSTSSTSPMSSSSGGRDHLTTTMSASMTAASSSNDLDEDDELEQTRSSPSDNSSSDKSTSTITSTLTSSSTTRSSSHSEDLSSDDELESTKVASTSSTSSSSSKSAQSSSAEPSIPAFEAPDAPDYVDELQDKAANFMSTKYGALEGKWIVLIAATVAGLFTIMATTACILRSKQRTRLRLEQAQLDKMSKELDDEQKQREVEERNELAYKSREKEDRQDEGAGQDWPNERPSFAQTPNEYPYPHERPQYGYS